MARKIQSLTLTETANTANMTPMNSTARIVRDQIFFATGLQSIEALLDAHASLAAERDQLRAALDLARIQFSNIEANTAPNVSRDAIKSLAATGAAQARAALADKGGAS